MQNIVMQSVNMLSVIMLNVAARILKEIARDKRSSLLGYGFITFSYYL